VFCLPELEARKNTFNILRKPEFQRATSDWTPRQVVELVKNFVDGDLIPAVIIWNSPSIRTLPNFEGSALLGLCAADPPGRSGENDTRHLLPARRVGDA
jgi:hypothetical protein